MKFNPCEYKTIWRRFQELQLYSIYIYNIYTYTYICIYVYIYNIYIYIYIYIVVKCLALSTGNLVRFSDRIRSLGKFSTLNCLCSPGSMIGCLNIRQLASCILGRFLCDWLASCPRGRIHSPESFMLKSRDKLRKKATLWEENACIG